MIRILLVEQEALVSAALQKLLESWSGFEVIACAAMKDEALALARRLDPDLILLSLPSKGPLDLQTVRDLSRATDHARLLVLIGQSDPSLPVRVVLQGARGAVEKHRAADELKKAIQKVCNGGELWLNRVSVASLITQVIAGHVGNPKEESSSRFGLLTEREREVVALVVQGHTNKQVGSRLYISETTVRHHLTTIFNKLRVSNRYGLLTYFHQDPSLGASRRPVPVPHG